MKNLPLLFVVSVVAAGINVGCGFICFYNYGVRIGNSGKLIEQEDGYPSRNGYMFASEFKKEEGKPQEITININHLFRVFYPSEKNKYISSVYINVNTKDKNVEVKRIVIEHRDKKGKLLHFISDEPLTKSNPDRWNKNREYLKKDLPNLINEYVYVEISVDGENYIWEENVELKYVKYVPVLDAIMSI